MRKLEYLLLLIILVGALAVRLYKINNPIADWHSWRQADTASVSWVYSQEGIDLLRPRYHDIGRTATGFENLEGWRFVEFPIYNALHAYLFNTFGRFSFEVWGRIISIAASLVSTVLMFFIGKRFLGQMGGVLSAFFFAFLPFNIFFSRVILPEPVAVMFSVGAIWSFVVWIDRQKWWQLVFAMFAFTLALLMKPYTVFYGVPMVYLAISKFGLRGVILNGKLWIFSLLVFIPLMFWRGWMSGFIEGIPHWKWAFNGDEIRFKPAFWWWILGERLGRLILGGWGLGLFILGMLYSSKDKYPYFIQAFIAGQILYFIVVATASVRHDYYQTLAIPAITLIVSAGVIIFWNLAVGNTLIKRFVLLGTVGLAFLLSLYQVKEFYKINHPEIIIAGVAAQKLIPKDALIIAPYNGDTAFLYQTKRRGWAQATLPMEKMVSLLGAQYYVSVNFDAQTKEVMEKYQVLEKTNEYVVVKLK